MTILELLAKATGGKTGLVELLRGAGQASHDLKPKADEWIAALEGATAQSNLVALAAALPAEIAAIVSGKLDPRSHPSDAV